MKVPYVFIVIICVVLYYVLNKHTTSEIQKINITIPELASFIQECAEVRQSKYMLVRVENYVDSIVYSISDLRSTCVLRIGDEFGYLVGKEWTNVTAPLIKSYVGETIVYFETGIEPLIASRSRYAELVAAVRDDLDICIESYNESDDSFRFNAPRTSVQMEWRAVLLDYSMDGGNLTEMILCRPVDEGYDTAHYERSPVKVAKNYREKHYQ